MVIFIIVNSRYSTKISISLHKHCLEEKRDFETDYIGKFIFNFINNIFFLNVGNTHKPGALFCVIMEMPTENMTSPNVVCCGFEGSQNGKQMWMTKFEKRIDFLFVVTKKGKIILSSVMSRKRDNFFTHILKSAIRLPRYMFS